MVPMNEWGFLLRIYCRRPAHIEWVCALYVRASLAPYVGLLSIGSSRLGLQTRLVYERMALYE